MPPPVVAQAVVDQLSGGRSPLWRVTVKGQAPYDHERHYDIMARTEDGAAWEGIALFEADMLREVAPGLVANDEARDGDEKTRYRERPGPHPAI